MNEDAGLIAPEPPAEEAIDTPLLDQARKIEKDMFQVMNIQVKLAFVQVALAVVSIVIALIIALLR